MDNILILICLFFLMTVLFEDKIKMLVFINILFYFMIILKKSNNMKGGNLNNELLDDEINDAKEWCKNTMDMCNRNLSTVLKSFQSETLVSDCNKYIEKCKKKFAETDLFEIYPPKFLTRD